MHMIHLDGIWHLTDEHGEYETTVAFPGDIHTALLAAGIIPDPFIGTNEAAVQWVARRGWRAWRSFTVPSTPDGGGSRSGAGPYGRLILELESVDTVAQVFINGTAVAQTTNMFVPLRADIGHAVRAGENTIEVHFESPEAAAAARAEQLPYPVPHQIYPLQSMHRNLLRKVQCHGSWDWGIALMLSGLAGRLLIRRTGEEALLWAYGIPRRRAGREGTWELPVHVEWDRRNALPDSRAMPDGPPESPVEVLLLAPDGFEVARGGAVALPRPGEIIVTLGVDHPELWWPAGYGGQPLYTVVVRFGAEERRFTTAFREVELVNEPDARGRSMFFRVNGRDIWAKGANWIPVDAFTSRQTPDRYRNLLADAVDANMNMIRVWGGGRYEDDTFYDTCDRLGLLVWQDFMFSCSLYPSQGWFLEEVRAEVYAQTRRLLSHPSIAIWCGNNEDIGALGWFEESRANPGRYLIDFDRLNNGVIAAEVRAADDTRVFWPSSPAAGEGDFSDNWHDDSSGDMHYWSVWHEGKSFDAYYDVVPRFCSEFGFQSFPSIETLRQFAGPDELNPTAPVMEHHQRNPRGNTVILETISRYFRVPFDFADFVYLSQVQQAMAIATAVEYWRTRRPESMGALYWQLNDLWPVVSWSSIEYDGRWKLLHYAARRFFAPQRVIVVRKDDVISVSIVNDTAAPLSGSVALRFLDWSGRELAREDVPVADVTAAAAHIRAWSVAELPARPVDAFLAAELTDADGARVDRTITLLTDFKRAPLEQPGLEPRPTGPDTLTITCTAAPAFRVSIEPEDPRFTPDDNGFDMLPGERREITLRPIRGRAAADVTGPPETTAVRVRSIRDTY